MGGAALEILICTDVAEPRCCTIQGMTYNDTLFIDLQIVSGMKGGGS